MCKAHLLQSNGCGHVVTTHTERCDVKSRGGKCITEYVYQEQESLCRNCWTWVELDREEEILVERQEDREKDWRGEKRKSE